MKKVYKIIHRRNYSFLNMVILGLSLIFLIIPVVCADDNWVQVTSSAEWSARGSFGSVVMPDDSIIVMGGRDANGDNLNDVWRSTDNGATWTQVTANAEWTGRVVHNTVALPDGSIVLIGGADRNGVKNDVWRSTDNGATWAQVTANAGLTPRESLSSVVMTDGSIIVSGGTLPGGYTQFNDVWRSTDKGDTWNQVTANAEWRDRTGHSSVALPDGSIVVMGGHTFGPGDSNDVWRSTNNGVTWTQVNASAGWRAREHHSTEMMADGSIILFGGNHNTDYLNDVWRSADNGATWTQVTPDAGWTARTFQSSVVMSDGSIVMMGGYNSRFLNDVWRLVPAESSGTVPTDSSGKTPGNPGKFLISANSTILLSKTISPQVMKQGTDASVTIILTNAGSTPIYDIELLDESLPEFPETAGQKRAMRSQMLMPDETRILRYSISAAKPGKFTFNGTQVMFAGEDGNYHLIRSNAPTVRVLEPLITTPEKSSDIWSMLSGFFRKLLP